MNCEERFLKNPNLDLIVDRFGGTLPHYMGEAPKENFINNIRQNNFVSIFGPSAYLGHSLVVNRVIVDLLQKHEIDKEGSLSLSTKTPCMPEYLSIDLSTLEMRIDKVSVD